MTPNEEAALAELEWELGAPHTLDAIAEHLGCSLRTVSRIETRALDKLRALISEDYEHGVREPDVLGLRVGDVFPSDGMTRRSGEQ